MFLKQFQARLTVKSMTAKVPLGMMLTKEKRNLKILQQFQTRLPATSMTAKVILGTMLKKKRILK